VRRDWINVEDNVWRGDLVLKVWNKVCIVGVEGLVEDGKRGGELH
jgi:hypothetical protein